VPRPEYYGNPAGLTVDVDVVRAIYDAFARRDLDAALHHIAEDCTFHLEGTARETGRPGPYRGHAGMREYFADVGRVWEQLELHADDIRAVHGSVVVIGHITAVREGAPLQRAVLWTWHVRDGRATYVRVSDLGELQ
jgi:ketosteroid isomerase-like protein